MLWAGWQGQLQDVDWWPHLYATAAGFEHAAAQELIYLLGSRSPGEALDFQSLQKIPVLLLRNSANLLACNYVSNQGGMDGFKPYDDLNSLATLPSIGPSLNWFEGSKFRQRQQTCCVMLWMFMEEASDLNPSAKHTHYVTVKAKNCVKHTIKSLCGGNGKGFRKLT